MRLVTAVLGATLMLCASAASAQDKPNFSGKWTLDAEKTAAANPAAPGAAGGRGGAGGGRMGGGMMGGGALTLTVDAASMTTERDGQNGAIRVAYKLDGSDQTITMGQGQATAKAKWDGNTVVVETTRQGGPMGAMTTRAVYAMEGEWLVISTTTPTPNGEMSRKQYYRKN